jgi:hypothetical protein
MEKIRTSFDSSDDATAAFGNAAKITQKQATRIFIAGRVSWRTRDSYTGSVGAYFDSAL